MKSKGIKTFDIALSAVFTALIAVASQFSVETPFGIPLTFQTFAVALSGYVLGTKRSVAAVFTYIMAGAAGFPVFYGFTGGIQHILGTTGGFITGFLLLSFFCGFPLKNGKTAVKLAFGAIGLVLCHLVGVLYFSLISGIGFIEAFVSASLPFIFKDYIFVVLACVLAKKIKINKFLK